MNKDEALKLALEALENIDRWLPTIGQKGLRDYEADAITAIKEALANEALDKMAENARELGLDYEPAQPFITHNVEKPYDWSEWVCPDPKGYLMKCCDCGLVHEAEFAVVRYKSETEREDCDMVDDPNLQAVFRMRRSEEWTPEDTAHRSGGLPMAQPEQEPIGEIVDAIEGAFKCSFTKMLPVGTKLYTTPPQRTWAGLTDEEIKRLGDLDLDSNYFGLWYDFARAIEAKLKLKNS